VPATAARISGGSARDWTSKGTTPREALRWEESGFPVLHGPMSEDGTDPGLFKAEFCGAVCGALRVLEPRWHGQACDEGRFAPARITQSPMQAVQGR